MTKEKVAAADGTSAMNPISPTTTTGVESPSISNPKGSSNASIDAGSAPTNNVVIVQNNNASVLINLPNEIKQRIWSLAVTVDKPITPFQLRPKSNKFYWSRSLQKLAQAAKEKIQPLTAVQLSKVCRQLYQEVSLTYLFYKVNHFDFQDLDPKSVITYLVAITTPRQNAIRSVSVQWGHEYSYYKGDQAEMFTMLSACQGLQSLDIKLSTSITSHLHSWNQPMKSVTTLQGFKEWQVAIRGLKTLNLEYDADAVHDELVGKMKTVRGELDKYSREQLAMVRGVGINSGKLMKLQLSADLDVHGEGRLSEDRKPGVISSRTRQGVRNVTKVADDGTLPKRVISKYDLNGDLAWVVYKVEAVREVWSGDGIEGIEFKVTCGPEIQWFWEHLKTFSETTWEDASVLNSRGQRDEIVDYYAKNLKEPGMQLVLDTWKLRIDEDGHEQALKVDHEKRLAGLIKKQASAELQEVTKANKKLTKTVMKTKKPKLSSARH